MADKTGRSVSWAPYMSVGERLKLNKATLLSKALEKEQKWRGREKTEKERMQSSFFIGKDVKLSC